MTAPEPTVKAATWLNKSSGTNLVAAACVLIGLILPEPMRRPVLHIGLFALSGAITNWLAIHMLFEKIPGLYGSGVIPARFEDFKHAIHRLMMEQFFSQENFTRFFAQSESETERELLDFDPVLDQTDLTPAFDALVSVVVDSSFGAMLNMVGGAAALQPLKEPFIAKMKDAIKALAHSPSFQDAVRAHIAETSSSEAMMAKVDAMVQLRLEELTPQLVKEIMQQMIREHLGWLVIWGGVFGGLIGLVMALIPFF